MIDNRRQNKIIIYSIIIFIIFIYISSLFIHSIIDRGKIKNTISTDISGEVKGVDTEKDNEINNNGSQDNKDNNTNNNTDDNRDNNNSNDNNSDNGNNSNGGEIVDNKDRIKVMQNGRTNWNELKELDFFKNSYFEDNAIIAPGVHGSYSFTVENVSDESCKYSITYTPENIYNINMVYKLKLNGKYIAGNDNNWVSYEKLNTIDINLNRQSSDIYTVEWKWQDASNDTEVGETEGAYYKMYINVVATQVAE